MEHRIEDLEIYLYRMQKSVLDKMFFMDKIFEPVKNIVDFGCANGELIKALHTFWGDYNYIGYDISEIMVEAARRNVPEAKFYSNWDDIDVDFDESIINISSTIHEVYSYGSKEDVLVFWQRVFESGFKYITIRDMMLSNKDMGLADECDIEKIYMNINYQTQLKDYEAVWGEIKSTHDLIHYLLKYQYTQNWEREVRENYLPITVETLKSFVPDNYEIVYESHSVLPYIAYRVKLDFGIDLKIPTHIKIILKKK